MLHLNIRVDYTTADYNDLVFPEKDKAVLRGLARQQAEIAARPIMAERKKLWCDHNALKPTRPVLLCDPENGWNEIIPDSGLQCQNSIARHWEATLRKNIFWGNEMNDDYVVDGLFKLPYVHTKHPWTVKGRPAQLSGDAAVQEGKAYHIDALLEDYSQLNEVKPWSLDVDRDTTEKLLATAHEIFDGTLETVVNTVWFWSFGLTDTFAAVRGMENMLYDFYDEPEGIHQLMQMAYDATVARLDFLEAEKLLSLNNDNTFVGSGGLGYTDELPAADFAGAVRTRDMWGLAESQITVGVSPDMFREFIFPYHKKLMERFGLTCYACCEPMDDRIDIVREVKNLRRVSVSHWADKQVMSQKLGTDYVYSMKPTPADLAVPHMDEEHVRRELRQALDITKNNRVELIMKDNHTLGGNPRNLTRWVEIAREEIEKM